MKNYTRIIYTYSRFKKKDKFGTLNFALSNLFAKVWDSLDFHNVCCRMEIYVKRLINESRLNYYTFYFFWNS